MQDRGKGYKRFINYLDIADATGKKVSTVRVHARGNSQRERQFDPTDVESLVEYVCKQRGWEIRKGDDMDKIRKLTTYSALAQYLGKTKDEVWADREAGILDIGDTESVVRYICDAKGWRLDTNT